jgi:membrane associated rhomboid family serine protease
MLPIGIKLKQRRLPVVNYLLLAANVALFFVTLANEPLKNRLALPARDIQQIADKLFLVDLVLFSDPRTALPADRQRAMLVAIREVNPDGPRILQETVNRLIQEELRRRLTPHDRRRRPLATREIAIVAATGFFKTHTTAEGRRQYAVRSHGLVDGGVWAQPWTLITHGFMHAGWMHILGNMIFLWLFGNALNSRLGHAGYAASYVFFLLCAAFAHYYLENAPAVGASGAIAGVSGAFVIYFPFVRVRALWGYYAFWRVIQVPAILYIGFEFVYNILMQLSGDGGNVAWWAHIGGYVAGFLLGYLLLATGLSKPLAGVLDLNGWLQRRRERPRYAYGQPPQQPYGPWQRPQTPEQHPRERRDDDDAEDDLW